MAWTADQINKLLRDAQRTADTLAGVDWAELAKKGDSPESRARDSSATAGAIGSRRDHVKGLADAHRGATEAMSVMLGLADAAEGSTARALGKMLDGLQKSTLAAKPFSDQYLKVINQFGGGFEDYANLANKSAQATSDVTQRMISQYADLGKETALSTGITINDIFKNVDEYMEAFRDLTTKRATENYAVFRSSNENLARDMALTGKNLQFDAEQLSTFISREVSLTGKATGTMLKEVNVFSSQVAQAVGASDAEIAQHVEKIIANTQRFGNVGREEAAKIAGQLYVTGLNFQELNATVGKFQSFESAATAVGELTSVFGMQLDAMELMQLANEDQGEFLARLREGFVSTGRSLESYTQAEKQLIMQSTGLTTIGAVERLIDPTRANAVADAMDAMSGAIDADQVEQDITQMVDNIVPITDAATRINKFVNELFMIGTAEMSRAISTGTVQLGQLATAAAQVGGSTMDIEAFYEQLTKIGDFAKEFGLEEMLQPGFDLTDNFLESTSSGLAGTMEKGAQVLNDAASAVLEGGQKLVSTGEDVAASVQDTAESLETVTVDVRPTEVLLEAFNSAHLGQAAAVEKLTGLGEKIEELISQIMATTGETSEPLQVTVQLDGQPIIDRIISNPAGSNNIVISTERVGP